MAKTGKLPYIGGYNIKDITVPELLGVILKIEARGAIETAHRTRGIVSEVYAYAIGAGKAERNIAHDLQGALQVKPAVQHMATITQPAKVGELLRAVWGYEGDEITKAAYNHALHLQRRADMLQWYADYLDGLWEVKA